MSQEKTPENFCMLQGFEWYAPADQKHWTRMESALEGLKATGVDNIWIPPGCKGSNPQGNGYDVYDLYDLGEFDQKGSVPTKWGDKQSLMALAHKAKEVGIGLYWDAVLNQRAGGDRTEDCTAVEVDPNWRLRDVTDPYTISAWVGFDFAGRNNQYSSQKYHWYHFSGVDYNAKNGKTAIYRIEGQNKYWAMDVDREKGDFDYLMFADVDYSHPEVQQDVKDWGVWLVKELGLSGIRFDAIKHYSEGFLHAFIENLDANVGSNLFFVGEFWEYSRDQLAEYLSKMSHRFSLFDSPLVYNFSRISSSFRGDLRQVFDNTLVQIEPYNAVTLVMNHDTQPYQALQAPIDPYFKPLAYALILLRDQGYPCLFYGDVYGIKGDHPQDPACGGKIPDMCLARKLYAYGAQHDYFDEPNCIGWTREGTWDKPHGLACIITNWGPTQKKMYVGPYHAGEVWTDILGWQTEEVTIGEDGNAMFPCPGPVSVSIFVKKDAPGRDRFGKFNANIYQG